MVTTNTVPGSVARAQHSEPTVKLLGRVAAAVAGYIGILGSENRPHLHFTLIISDAYDGVIGFDG